MDTGSRGHFAAVVIGDRYVEQMTPFGPKKSRCWEHYRPGGRFRGYFPLRSASAGRLGEVDPSIGKGSVPSPSADFTTIRGVDWEKARKKAIDAATIKFEKWRGCFAAEDELPRGWAELQLEHFGNLAEKRATYMKQPAIASASKWCSSFDPCPVDDMGFNLGDYLERVEAMVLVPEVVVSQGSWLQRGRTSIYGQRPEEVSAQTWGRMFHTLISRLAPATQLTAVDCW